ncbi:MAG: ParB/RepB/Spo0J family partition protein [Caulobacteraceae bacterium]|nr:ParB/RepB/Spo0J family partition protein [Caulobacteraceae bacterium]
MTDVIMIPLTKLVESEDNVRRVNRKDGISSLAQSIKSLGLIQSIVVRDTGNGKFAVIAGGRRLRALRLLAKTGDIEKNAPIPCRVISGDDNAIELSLAENVVRHDLLPWEELSVYGRLIDSGEGPETIAARFGVSPQHVVRRLKLARVSPRLIEALKRKRHSTSSLRSPLLTTMQRRKGHSSMRPNGRARLNGCVRRSPRRMCRKPTSSRVSSGPTPTRLKAAP